MLVRHRVTPPPTIIFGGTHLYTWSERGSVRVKCFPQEHNAMPTLGARSQNARSGVGHSNNEATASLTVAEVRS